MKSALADVRGFHAAMDVPAPNVPCIPSSDRVELRLRLINEEVDELHVAVSDGDIVEVADALADIIYVAIGMAIEFGIPLDRVWDEVQRTNMAKVDPTTGKVHRRADGKVLKPDGWTPPDIAAAIR